MDFAHSLKREIGPAATNRHADLPKSMTPPTTTLPKVEIEFNAALVERVFAP